jgi:ABC-type protease/lipase transport system fused ATPase/permease subunit
MTKDEIISEVGKPILRTLGFLQGVFLLAFCSSPFIWIWVNFDISWKTGLTGFIGAILTSFIYKTTRKVIKEAVEETIGDAKDVKLKSKFQERISDMAKRR